MNTRTSRVLLALSVCLVFLSINGVIGGVLMLADPRGAPMGMPVSYLERTPFDSFIIPGLVLIFVWGCGSFVTLWGLWRRPQWPLLNRLSAPTGQHWAWTASVALGLALMVWLTVQVFTLPAVAVIQFILYALAALLVGLPLLPSMRRFYRLTGPARSSHRHQPVR